jgi:hypothetical protein
MDKENFRVAPVAARLVNPERAMTVVFQHFFQAIRTRAAFSGN